MTGRVWALYEDNMILQALEAVQRSRALKFSDLAPDLARRTGRTETAIKARVKYLKSRMNTISTI